MTSFLLCFSTVLIFKFLDLCWSMAHHSKKGGFEPVLWSLAPYLWGPGSCSMEVMARHTSSSCLHLACHPKNENLALADHVSVSIPASLQVIACLGSLWCDTLVFFNSFFHLFVWSDAFQFLQTWEVYLVCHMRIMLGNKSWDK